MARKTHTVLLLAGMMWLPGAVTAQLEITAGVTVLDDPIVDGAQVGPTLAISTSLVRLGVPASLELGMGRTDFTSLAQDYHNDHYLVAAVAQWQVLQGPTGIALRLGLGAYAEYQTVETDPPMDGGDNWTDMVAPGIAVTRLVGHDTRVLLTLTDALLGPMNAILDPDEFGIEHRVRILIGIQL